MTPQPDIVAFLTARLRHDEFTVRRLFEGPDRDANAILQELTDLLPEELRGTGAGAACEAELGGFLKHFDKARMLADIAAKRKLLSWHEEDRHTRGQCSNCFDPIGQHRRWPCHVVTALAAPYAGHPDFQDAWKITEGTA